MLNKLSDTSEKIETFWMNEAESIRAKLSSNQADITCWIKHHIDIQGYKEAKSSIERCANTMTVMSNTFNISPSAKPPTPGQLHDYEKLGITLCVPSCMN